MYIGEGQDWTLNQKCPGGPFMVATDPNSKTFINSVAKDVWNGGTEIWCNMQGRYTHIVANLAHMTPPYTMSLCNIGIMGARYGRVGFSLPTDIEIQSG